MKTRLLTGLVLGLFSLAAVAQTLPYFVTDGDDQMAYIIQNGALQGTFSTTEVDGDNYPIAVVTDVRIADDIDLDSAVYSLAGVFTGATFSGGGVSFNEMLDGTTDGSAFNYACQFGGGNNVVRADRNWGGGTSIFSTGFAMTGCAYDLASGSIWVIDDSGPSSVIREFSTAGALLNSFTPAVPERLCCLAYDASNDSLWFLQNDLGDKTSGDRTGSGHGAGIGKGNGETGDRTIYEYSKAGTQLDAILISGFNPDNPWGGEMPIIADSPVVPTLNPTGLAVLLILIALSALVIMRRRTRRRVV